MSTLLHAAQAAQIDEPQPGRDFAAARGWIPGKFFTLGQLGAIRERLNPADHDYLAVMDHAEYFRWNTRPYKPAGIAIHVYSGRSSDARAARIFAGEYGLRFDKLDEPSWHSPGCWVGLYRRAR